MADFNVDKQTFDYIRGYTIDLDMKTGMSKRKETSRRYLSQMKGMFSDDAAYEKKLQEEGDALVYEFHEMGVPEHPGDLPLAAALHIRAKWGMNII